MCRWEDAGDEQTAGEYVGAGFKPAPTDGETEIVACRARKNQSSVTPTDLTSALQRAISEVSSVASSSGDEPPAA